MAKDLAIVLNNGSINSAVASALAGQRYRLVLMHAETAAQPGSRARGAYDQQVAHFKPYREHTISMPFLAAIRDDSVAAATAADPRRGAMLGRQLTDLLPLIATAARFAAHYQAAAIYLGLRIGAHGDELAQATEFGQVWNELLQLPCAMGELELVMPLLELDPWQVVDVGFQVGAPFERTWSCLGEAPEPCWACPACRAREAAFTQAAKLDPMRAAGRKA